MPKTRLSGEKRPIACLRQSRPPIPPRWSDFSKPRARRLAKWIQSAKARKSLTKSLREIARPPSRPPSMPLQVLRFRYEVSGPTRNIIATHARAGLRFHFTRCRIAKKRGRHFIPRLRLRLVYARDDALGGDCLALNGFVADFPNSRKKKTSKSGFQLSRKSVGFFEPRSGHERLGHSEAFMISFRERRRIIGSKGRKRARRRHIDIREKALKLALNSMLMGKARAIGWDRGQAAADRQILIMRRRRPHIVADD